MDIQLKAMNERDFQWFYEESIKNFAQDKIENGSWKSEGALEQAREVFSNLLPAWQHTPNHFLRKIVNQEGEKVGYLWYAKKEDAAQPYVFLYEIFLISEVRGRGLGKQAISLLKQEAQRIGIDHIWLHVFGHNQRAFHFYEQLGFHVTDYSMRMEID